MPILFIEITNYKSQLQQLEKLRASFDQKDTELKEKDRHIEEKDRKVANLTAVSSQWLLLFLTSISIFDVIPNLL